MNKTMSMCICMSEEDIKKLKNILHIMNLYVELF